MDDNNETPPFEILEAEELFHGKWLSAKQVFFRKRGSPTESPHVWQIPYRSTRSAGSVVDGVSVIAILKKRKGEDGNDCSKSIILVKQYRIPIMAYSIEFPSGLVDVGETPLEAAHRELKEETGYTASRLLRSTTGIQNLDPGLTNDSVNVFVFEIDGDSECNRNVVQKLDETESIDVLIIPLSDLMEKLRHFSEVGYQVEASLYTFALGLVLNGML
ncbi:unnamed protein product [Soboliphyme baturini]|uniref:Nudix hydrolase domain-containing protein n=1 Tax=Soboliphyme baturini TaxID=241478 RepID=A0A183I950_9BILA|nr:unnamed protein product [Soboliphyme baturini]